MRIALAAILTLSAAAAAEAHDGPHAQPAGGVSPWDAGILILLAICAGLYALGSRRLAARRARVRRVERVAFWTGWTAMVVAVAPPLDRAAAATFSAHMIQHELLMLVGAPLLIVGRPIVPWLWAFPGSVRRGAGGAWHGRAATSAWRWLTLPLVAWALHGLAVWVWHAPGLYERAVEHEGVHALQHATFVATSVLFWWGLVYGRYGRAAYGASALYVFTTMVHTGVLGAMFALSQAPFYRVYQDRAAAAGVDAVTDQQLAGLYMWVPAGLILTVFGLALFVAWLAEAERRQRTV